MFSMRGKGHRVFRKKWYGPLSSRLFPVIGETGFYQIPIVGAYKHLGGILHHGGDLKQEIRRRIGIAHQTFTQHRRLLFQNKAIPLTKRAELFRCLVLSKLMYGTDSWIIKDQKTKGFFHAAVLKLYKRLLGVRPEVKIPDDRVLTMIGLPSPTELLRVSRFAISADLVRCGQGGFMGPLEYRS